MYWHNFLTDVIYLLRSLVISLLQRLHQHDTRSENLEQNFAEWFTDSISLIDTAFTDELDLYIENANRRANKNSLSALKEMALYEATHDWPTKLQHVYQALKIIWLKSVESERTFSALRRFVT